jgi:DNA-binding NtrC family response regulator
VLVVDDEPAVRNILTMALTRHGIPVWTAESGEQAFDVYREHHRSIGAVLLDVRLPGISGPELWQTLSGQGADIPCCFMSADLGAHTEAGLRQIGGRHFFPKPFSLQNVAETIRGLLPN